MEMRLHKRTYMDGNKERERGKGEILPMDLF